jgi:hypothetical protein
MEQKKKKKNEAVALSDDPINPVGMLLDRVFHGT